MNDAVSITSPVNLRQSVGNSRKPAQVIERVRVLERDDDFTLASMWTTFIHQASREVANSFKPLTNPQISLYGSNYRTLISNTESGEGVVSSGAVVQVLDYYPYGDERIDVESGADEKRKFAGMYRDDESGLDYAMARYYDNTRGQFLSQDPSFLDIGRAGFEQNYGRTLKQHLMNPQALNSYSWALNNPIIYKDPDGEIVPLLVLGALAFYGGYSAGTDLYEGYTSGDSGQFAWGAVGAVTSLIPGGGAAKGAAALTDDAARAGFKSFEAFKRAMGPAGEGREWHHLVEQGINKDKFPAEMLHSTKNIVNISTDVHRKVSAYSSSIRSFTEGLTVRQWVSSKSFQQQLSFAKQQLQSIQKQLDKLKSQKSKQ